MMIKVFELHEIYFIPYLNGKKHINNLIYTILSKITNKFTINKVYMYSTTLKIIS